MTAIHIQGLGTYVPTKRITNVDLMSLVDTNDEWIVSRTGIKARHMLADDENGSDAGTEASTQGTGHYAPLQHKKNKTGRIPPCPLKNRSKRSSWNSLA